MANDIDPLTTRPSVLVTAPGPERAAWYLGCLLTYLATGEETGAASR